MTFFDRFDVFFRFLAEKRFRTIMKLPQKASSRTQTCSFGTSVTLPEVTVCAYRSFSNVNGATNDMHT